MGSLKECIGKVMTPVMTGKQIFFPLPGIAEHCQRLAGIKSEIFYEDVDINTEIGCLGAEYYETYPTFSWDVYNFEARALGQPVTTAEFGLPDIDYNNPIVTSEKDLDKIKWPTKNPLDAGRYPLFLKQREMANTYFGFEPVIFEAAVSSFTLACFLVSFSGFMQIIKKQPALAHEILRRIVDDIHVPLVKAVAERFPGIAFKFADAWEMIPNISPKIQREYAWNYYDRLLEQTKDCNTTIGWWMTYGEGAMPDPEAYLKEKIQYSHGVSNAHTENCPREIYHKVAQEMGMPFSVQIPALTIMDGPEDAIIEYVREVAKTQRYGIDVDKFSWAALLPATAKPAHIKAVQAAGNAFSILPYPTPDEFDKIKVEVPKLEESFGDFCRRKAKENPDGYTFKWLEQAKFMGE